MKLYRLRIKRVLVAVLVFITVLFLSILFYYKASLGRVSNSNASKEIVIEQGLSSKKIAKLLKDNSLIKNEFTFLVYIKLNNASNLKFGTYLMSEDMGVKKIVKLLEEGSDYNPDEVTITFPEGINMRDVASIIASKTNNSLDDVINKANDVNYINKLKEKYWFITDSLDNDNLYYKLEGYLYPETYKLSSEDISVEYIFDKMIEEMAKHLEKYRNFDYSNMTVHEYLSLASMIEKESPVKSDRSKIARVFLNRKNIGMNLGSDVTARYANRVDDKTRALTVSELEYKSLYNTRLSDGSMNGKLPVGPISLVSISSIEASFNPSDGDYLYFISNILTQETFFYENYNDFLIKKNELASVNQGF